MRFPNGYGSIINLGKKRRKPFAVRITTGVEEYLRDGKKQYRQKYKYLGYFEKRKDALDFLAKYNADPQTILNNITFKELYEEFKERQLTKLSPRTLISYETNFNKCQELYNKPFKDITFYHLQKIIDDNSHLANLPHLKSFFSKLYNYAAKYGFKNYATYIELPARQAPAKQKKEYTKDEIALLWANLDLANVDIILILLYTGMRVSELLDMKIEHIHLKERYMFVEQAKTFAGIRKVPLHKKILPLIEAKYDPNNKYLFLNMYNKKLSYNTFYQAVINLFKRLNIDHIVHETRHTFVSQCNRLELNSLAVKRIIGHSNENITQHYTQVNIDDLLAVIDKFNY